MDSNLFIIKSRCGLCNRIRFILSFLNYLKKSKKFNKKKICIIWQKDSFCNGYFVDYFQKIKKNIIFIKNKELLDFLYNEYNEIDESKMYNDIKHTHIIKDYSNYIPSNYLKLNKNIYLEIKSIIQKLQNKYISVHIRRTDLDIHLKNKENLYDKRTSDKEFINFINNHQNYNLYIATDNYETQNLFYQKFKSKIKHLNVIFKTPSLRKTSLKQAIIDLFLCSLSNKFKGTYYSSFTDFIKLIRSSIVKKKKIINSNRLNPLESLQLFI